MNGQGPDGPDLAARYEELRAFALGESAPGAMPQGWVLLLRQGLAAWITAWRSSAAPSFEEPDGLRAPRSVMSRDAVQAELARVLAGMALQVVGG